MFNDSEFKSSTTTSSSVGGDAGAAEKNVDTLLPVPYPVLLLVVRPSFVSLHLSHLLFLLLEGSSLLRFHRCQRITKLKAGHLAISLSTVVVGDVHLPVRPQKKKQIKLHLARGRRISTNLHYHARHYCSSAIRYVLATRIDDSTLAINTFLPFA